jgi:hypothetical protein
VQSRAQEGRYKSEPYLLGHLAIIERFVIALAPEAPPGNQARILVADLTAKLE